MRRWIGPLLTAALASGSLALATQAPARADVTLDPSGAEPFSIGNRVFLDDGSDGAGGFSAVQRNNGLQDSGEAGVDGVRVELYLDVDSDGVADPGEFARYDLTAGGGYYLFDDLPRGRYLVMIPASEFAVGEPLGGYHSSSFDGTSTFGATGAVGTPATDTDDNGIEPTNRRPDLSGVTSNPVTFVDGGTVVTDETDLSHEADPGSPANEVGSNDPTGWDGPGSIGRRTTGSQRDDASNVAVDFGFVPPMSIGNRIWLDDSSDPAQWTGGGSRDNAAIDATDDGNLTSAGLQNPGIANVVVQLYYDGNNTGAVDSGDTLIDITTTSADGYYLFDGLASGRYLVRIASTNFLSGHPLYGLISSYDGTAQASPTNQVDGNDNGVDEPTPATNYVTSQQIQLVYLSEATGETDPSPQTSASRGRYGEADNDSDLTVDFGFTRPPMSLGDQVWQDDHPTTQALRNNAIRNAGEPLIAGVQVALYRDLNSNGNVDAGEDTGLRDTTDATGNYAFDNLPPGNYLVAITASNFNAGGPLENMISSTSVTPNPLASDNQVDDNDNGRDTFVAGVGVISSSINLTYNSEPTAETGSSSLGSHGERNQDSDFSIDFGFYVPMSLGNRVWLDDSASPSAEGTTRDNGVLDPAADDLDNPNIAGAQGLGVAGVTLRLYRDLDADGVIDAGEDTGRTTTTNATGYYLFDGLSRGTYLVGVEASNFNAGSPLLGFRSSTDATTPTDDDVDSTDQGIGKTPSPTYGIITPKITLSYTSPTGGDEPLAEGDPTPQTQAYRGANGERDDFSNLTADFGFVRANRAPTAAGDSYSTPFGKAKVVTAPGVLGNDSDPESDTLTASVVDSPSHGTLSLNANGSFTYTPAAGYAGPDSFTYKADDSKLTSSAATVSLTVDDNVAPTADDDAYTTDFETARTVTAPGVLDGDTDPEGATLAAAVDTEPAHGDLTLDADGSFTYTPDDGYSGDDTFTYTASDGYDESDPATVTITVGADPNQAPTASDDSYTTAFGTAKTVTAPGVLGNDTDPEDDAITAVLVAGPSHGALTLNPDGSFTYTPSAGYSGPDSFTYKANDAKLDSVAATVSLTVSANLAPTAGDDSYTTPFETVRTVSVPGVLSNDSDPESKPFTAVLATSPTHGDLTLNADGSFTYTPDDGFSGDDTFTYQAFDGYTSSGPATVTITVGADPNQAPTAVGDSYLTAFGTTLDVPGSGVLGNDSDPDDDPLTAVLIADATHGDLTLDADGSFTYTPDAGFSGDDTFTYQADDSKLRSAAATVTVTVGDNGTPEAEDDSYATPYETVRTVAAPGVLGNDDDPDDDALTAVLVAGPIHGSLTLNADGSFTYTPTAGYAGPDSFTYRADDGYAQSTPATVSISVSARPNTSPTARGDSYEIDFETEKNVAAPGVLGNDSDPDADRITAALVAGPTHGTLTLRPDGSFSYTPAHGYSGPDSFTYRADDANLTSDPATVALTVGADPNGAPVAADDAYTTAYETTKTVAAPGLLGNDTDAESDDLTAALVDEPEHGSVTVEPDGSFRYTPDDGWSGDDVLTYVARDGSHSSEPATVTIRTKQRPAPTLSISNPHVRGEKIRVEVTRFDPRESYVIRIGGKVVLSGTADRTGSIRRNVVVPQRAPMPEANLVVRGDEHRVERRIRIRKA